MAIEVGSVVEGVVTGITNFGAFVELPEGKVGLIHISEVADVYVRDVRDFLKEQDRIKVKVLSMDERGKIGLSVKRLNPPPAAPSVAPSAPPPRRPGGFHDNRRPHRPVTVTFEDKLSKFLKDSDERLSELKRSTESKRGGRGARRGE